jgi:hypothetical protein
MLSYLVLLLAFSVLVVVGAMGISRVKAADCDEKAWERERNQNIGLLVLGCVGCVGVGSLLIWSVVSGVKTVKANMTLKKWVDPEAANLKLCMKLAKEKKKACGHAVAGDFTSKRGKEKSCKRYFEKRGGEEGECRTLPDF